MKKIFLSMICLMLGGIAFAQNATFPQNITLKALDGSTVQSSAIQNDGKPIIVNFWATWCKPCNRELNTIKEVYEEWQEETGVKLVAISIDDARSASRVKPHVDGNDWEYEVYLDQNQDLKRAMNVVNPPHTFVLNGKGEIVWQHASYVEGDEEELIAVVRKVAAESQK
jgi:thiol-disulfide isomerase/thioredoxin